MGVNAIQKKDLEKIWLYTFETWSVEQANYYYNLSMDGIEYLAQNPKIGVDLVKFGKDIFVGGLNHPRNIKFL